MYAALSQNGCSYERLTTSFEPLCSSISILSEQHSNRSQEKKALQWLLVSAVDPLKIPNYLFFYLHTC